MVDPSCYPPTAQSNSRGIALETNLLLPITAQKLLFLGYVIVGPIIWLIFITLAYMARRKMLLLKRAPVEQKIFPHVTILIPAKDEGLRIRDCLTSALGQDYGYYDVIAVDDRSTDNTGSVMDAMAAADSRLSVVHIQEGSLPEGWTGKNNALHTAAGKATGDWLLLVDSDVILKPQALSQCIALANYKKYDLLTLLPALETHTIWESSLIPLCSATAATMYLIALTNNDDAKNTSFANGQFMLMPRASYDAVGGHETVKDRFCEDIEMARIMKQRGMRTRVSWGQDLAEVRMYSGFKAIISGWSRIYYAAKVGNPKHVLAAIAFLLICCFTAYAALIFGVTHLGHRAGDFYIAAGAVHLGLITFFLSRVYRWTHNSAWNALLFFISGPVVMWALLPRSDHVRHQKSGVARHPLLAHDGAKSGG